ncbi:MAG: beta-ketoacyl synthase chain length factor [Desulfuromonadaceae bacterium]|nr:beta-ketoacyl synthase chain length factor [Desulfuromonadaceae bacterium]
MTATGTTVYVAGIGCVGGFGAGIDAFRAALKQGCCSPTPLLQQHPDGQPFVPAYLAQTDKLSDFVPKRALRRLDHYARLALLGGYLALADAGLSAQDCEDLGVIIASGYGATGTTFGFLDSILNDGDSCASPTSFSTSVHNVAAAYLSMQMQALGPNLTVSCFEQSMTAALHNALCWLQSGRVRRVLVGGVDEHNPVVNYCYGRFFGTQTAAVLSPFSEQHSALPGEGAAFLLLTTERPGLSPVRLTDVASGSGVPTMAAPTDVVLAGADGHGATAPFYRRLSGETPALRSCTPCYGSLPTGQAFDLAAATLMLRDRCCYGLCAAPQTNEAGSCPAPQRISVVKYSGDGSYGHVRLQLEEGSRHA